MIYSIFNKSKPINLVITVALVVISYLISLILPVFNRDSNTISALIFAIFSIFIVRFINKKNQFSAHHSFILLFFALFITVYWTGNSNPKIMYANFFILLAFRKIISLNTNKNTIQKIFDASLWISIASLFYFWSILFLIVLYVAILLYATENYKHWLVPLVSIFVVFTIVNSYTLFTNHSLLIYHNAEINFNLKTLLSIKNTPILVFFGTIFSCILVFFLSSIQHISRKNKTTYFIISIALCIALIIILLNNTISSFLFSFFPIAVLFSVVFKWFSKKWVQPILFYVLIISCVLLYFISP